MNRPFNVPIALPRGPEHYWSVANKFGAKGFTLGELAGCTNGVAYSTVKNWLYDMLKVGAIKTIGARKGPVGGAVQNLYAVALKAMKAPCNVARTIRACAARRSNRSGRRCARSGPSRSSS